MSRRLASFYLFVDFGKPFGGEELNLGRRRRRYITRGDAAVWCPNGRWGPRRTRVGECFAVFRAEQLYTALLKDNAGAVRPGAAGKSTYRLGEREFTMGWIIRDNAVWRRGRVFFQCPRCSCHCTRLYLPLAHLWLACRSCWGLTYVTRTHQNYKDSIWGRGPFARMFGTTQRDWALMTTADTRKERRAASRQRWAERRALLGAASECAESPAKAKQRLVTEMT